MSCIADLKHQRDALKIEAQRVADIRAALIAQRNAQNEKLQRAHGDADSVAVAVIASALASTLRGIEACDNEAVRLQMEIRQVNVLLNSVRGDLRDAKRTARRKRNQQRQLADLQAPAPDYLALNNSRKLEARN